MVHTGRAYLLLDLRIKHMKNCGLNKKLTVRHFLAKKQELEKIVSLSLYDAPTAKFAEDCGVELILVGDSLGSCVLGYKNTIPVTIEQSLHHCGAVSRGAKFAFLVGDMPFMTYHPSFETALKNAARYLQEGSMDGVKVEGGRYVAATVEKMVRAGVPVMGHIGLLPQNILTEGGYRVHGKKQSEADQLLDDAKAIEDAGAFSVVLECVPSELAEKISKSLSIPTIGIGSGPHCDGQIQVVNDILGLFTEFLPRHSKRYANLGEEMKKAFAEYASEVGSSKFPAKENSF